MDERPVVTCFLRNRGEVLLFEHSEAVGSDAGQWGPVAGHAADFDSPEAAARGEIAEETGLTDEYTLVRAGDPFPVEDADLGTRWLVHPFLFDCGTREVTTDEETATHEWTTPTAILRRATVPDLWTAYDRVRPTVETVATDADHGASYLSVRALEVLRDEAALAADRGNGWESVAAVARELLAARPSMTVVAARVDRAMHTAGDARSPTAVEDAARGGIRRAVDADEGAAELAADRLAGGRVATLSRSGTVVAALETADVDALLVAESRPGREGVWTAERLADTTNVTLTTDAAFAGELAARDLDALLVGADTILPDGAVVNKAGTWMAATVAAREGLDCYAVAASAKVATDDAVHVEERDPTAVYDGDADVAVANPTFDVTPADRFDAVLTERGPLGPEDVAGVAADHRAWRDWRS